MLNPVPSSTAVAASVRRDVNAPRNAVAALLCPDDILLDLDVASKQRALEHISHFFAAERGLMEEDVLASLPEREVFGPVLHVIRYRAGELERALDAVAATGYGLTLGIHSRIERFVERVRARLRVGNTYVNRNMIGAVVGVQPFGGEGLSGTGPKAGGPHYLPRFAVERTLTVNTAAAGGNAALLAQSD